MYSLRKGGSARVLNGWNIDFNRWNIDSATLPLWNID